ncbi:hypothetical protein ACTNDF_10640 [Segatella copri]|uniref:hypothetical protein n=1 Tax=Segatella copri TaxID=165179 RepID=UPI003F896293
MKSADKKRFDLFLCGFEIRRNKRGLQSSVGIPADLKSADKKRFDLFLCGFEIRRNKRGLQSSVGVPADLKSADKKRFDLFLCGFEIRRNWYFFVLAPLLEADCKSEIGNWRRIANPPKQAGIINPR